MKITFTGDHNLPAIPQITPTLIVISVQQKTAPTGRQYPIFVALERGLNVSR